MQYATAYKRRDGWYFHPESETTDGLLISSPPYLRLPLDAEPAELGAAVLSALRESRQGVPHPTEFSSEYPVYQLAGVASWAAFKKSTSHVGLCADDDLLTLHASESARPRSGFLYQEAREVRISRAASPVEVGEALVKAEALCR
jgi:hypothetical protein